MMDAVILDIPFLVIFPTIGANNHAITKPINNGDNTFKIPIITLNTPTSFNSNIPTKTMLIQRTINNNFKIFLLK